MKLASFHADGDDRVGMAVSASELVEIGGPVSVRISGLGELTNPVLLR